MVAAQAERIVTVDDGRRYTVDAFGCAWPDARAVLVVVHGRDREPDELASAVLSADQSGTLRVLAPSVTPRSWYDGRYDDVQIEGFLARDAGIAVIAAAVSEASAQGVPAIHLAGFSQGGCMVAEYLMALGARELASAAIFTGSLLRPAEKRRRVVSLDGLPVMVSGGGGDAWLPQADLERTSSILAAHGAAVELATFDDEDHVVRPAEIEGFLALVGRSRDTHQTAGSAGPISAL